MYYHVKVIGTPERISEERVHELMENPNVQWRKEKTPFGVLYIGEHDWAGYDKDGEWTVRPPYLKDGGKVPNKSSGVWNVQDQRLWRVFLES